MSTAVMKESNPWYGGKSPFNISYGKIMMWFFLISDAFTFATLLIVYGSLKSSSPWWPAPLNVFNTVPGLAGNGFPLVFVTIMTFILILSSVTMVLGVYEGHRNNKKGVIFWMLLTVLGGAAFLGCQALEWSHLIHEGLTLSFNPFGYSLAEYASKGAEAATTLLHGEMLASGDFAAGPSAFGMLFFVITGFHGTHVLSGVIINLIILINSINGVYERSGSYEMVEKVGLYWHFVDLVWVFVFLLFYLL